MKPLMDDKDLCTACHINPAVCSGWCQSCDDMRRPMHSFAIEPIRKEDYSKRRFFEIDNK